MHEFSTRPTEEMKLHEDRALRLMYEMRATPSKQRAPGMADHGDEAQSYWHLRFTRQWERIA